MSGHRWILLFIIALTLPATGCQVDGDKTSLWNPFVRADHVSNIDEEPLPNFVRRISDEDDKKDTRQPSAPIAKSRVESLLADGQRALQENRIADAQRHYGEVLQFLPDDATAHHGLAMAADLTENWKDAEDHYRQALRTRPQDANLLCDIGYSYLLQNRYSEAASYLSQAITINPSHENAHTNLAMLDLRQGNHEAARQRIVARFGNTAKATQILAALESQVGSKAASTLAASAAEIPANASFEEVREIARRERIAGEQRRTQQMLQTGMSTEESLRKNIPASNVVPGNFDTTVQHEMTPPPQNPPPQNPIAQNPGAQNPGANPARPWSILPPGAAQSAPPGSLAQPVDASRQGLTAETQQGQSQGNSLGMNTNLTHGFQSGPGAGGAYAGNSMPSSPEYASPTESGYFPQATSAGNPANNTSSSSTANFQNSGDVIPVRPSGAFQPPTQGVSYGQPMGFGQPPVGTTSYQSQNSGSPAGNHNFGTTSGANQSNWANQPAQPPAQNYSTLPIAGLNAGPGALFPIGQSPQATGNNSNSTPLNSMNTMNHNVSTQFQNGQFQNGQSQNGQPPMTAAYNTVGPQSGAVNMGNVSAPGSNSVINGAMYGQPVSTLPSQEWIMQQQMQQSGQTGQGNSYPGTHENDAQASPFGNSTTAPRPGFQAQPVNPLSSYENQLRQLDNQYNSTLQQMDRNGTANVPRAQY